MGEGKTRGRARLPATPDAVDVAMDAVGDDDLARKLLARHTELIDAQIASERLEHFNKRAMILFRSVLAAGALAIVLALAWMVVNARSDRGLVIEALSVPPDLAARGLTGETVAAELADRLGTIDRIAQSFRSAETMKVNWGDDIRIVIPSTGVSIGELNSFLRRQLGGQTIIGGSVYRTPTGLRLTVRAGAHGAIDQTGSDATLDAMVQKAAEGVFEKTQPYRYSKYLEFTGRRDEAMVVARRLAATSTDPKERAWAWAQISNLFIHTDLVKAAEAGYRGIREDPNNALAYLNANIAVSLLGRGGESVELSRKADALGVRGLGGLSEIGVNTSRANLANEPTFEGDYAESLRRLDRLSGAGYPGTEDLIPVRRAAALVAMHDLTGSRKIVNVRPDRYFAAHIENSGGLNAPQYAAAAVLDDWDAAAEFARQQLAVLALAPEGPELARAGRDRNALPRLAIALSRAGRIAEARAIVDTLPQDCFSCLRARMAVAGAGGDIAGAERWATLAEAMNRHRPWIALDLARLYLGVGRYAQALAAAQRAVALGPRFGDARKARGDALRKLGRLDEAVADYATAERAAPRWGRLQIDWGIAAIRLGNKKQARAHFEKAATMDLSAADKVLLDRLRTAFAT
ncbi:MAG: tetratricopeptide repeat protein [Pseudomonadota bacterium]